MRGRGKDASERGHAADTIKTYLQIVFFHLSSLHAPLPHIFFRFADFLQRIWGDCRNLGYRIWRLVAELRVLEIPLYRPSARARPPL